MRIMLTSHKTEERDDALQERYRQDSARERAEDARRQDLEDEKSVWSNALQARIDQEKKVEDALRDADQVLAAYRERFQ